MTSNSRGRGRGSYRGRGAYKGKGQQRQPAARQKLEWLVILEKKNKCTRCAASGQRSPHAGCKGASATCTYCNVKGHIQPACNKKYLDQRKKGQGQRSSPRKATQATGQDTGDDGDDSEGYSQDDAPQDDVQANQVTISGHAPCPNVQLTLSTKNISFNLVSNMGI